jgi:flagellar biosynthetic protein FliR
MTPVPTLFQITDAQLLDWVTDFAWPFLRITALLVAAPLFGARTVPVRIRVSLAVLLAIIIAPLYPAESSVAPFSLAGAITAAREIAIGLGIGFLVQLMFAAMAMAGEVVALSTGLAFATMVDPDRGGSVPLVGQYFVIFTTLLFLTFDGHLALLALLFDSFGPLPPGVGGIGPDGWRGLVDWGNEMFAGAVLVALPAAAALMLANVTMGLVARSAPQLNIFAVGFPVTLLLGLVVLLLGLPALEPQVRDMQDSVLERAGLIIGLDGGAPRAP